MIFLKYLLPLFIVFSVYSQDLSNLNINDLQKMLSNSGAAGVTGVSMSNLNEDIDKSTEYVKDPTYNTERLLDRAVDPSKYILGPGDILYVYIWGAIENKYDLTINAECKTIIPFLGEFDVKNRSVKDFREDVRKILNEKYKNVNISVSLKTMKEFKAYILGDVISPGSYVVNNATKISDLLKMADGPIDSLNPLKIKIKNTDLGDTIAELNISNLHGTYVHNPYVRLGDIVYVSKTNDYVRISGAINRAGKYCLEPNLTVKKVIDMSGGFSRGADSLIISVYRFFNNSDSISEFKLADHDLKDFKLMPDDRIIIKKIPDYRIHREIKIYGEVKYPGTYPVKKDKTTLNEVIEMSGGYTDNAFLKGSKIIRKKVSKLVDREFERLKTQPVFTLSPDERSYLKTKLTEESGLISIDFSNYEDVKDLIIRDGDKIIIAEKSLSIQVTGAVTQPGLVSYMPDKDFRYYINQAGGYNTRAKKRSVMIIKAGTNTWLKPREVDKIEAGDAIYIAEKQYVDIKEVLGMLGSIAAIIMAGLAIRAAIIE